jgi:hypothetical protein
MIVMLSVFAEPATGTNGGHTPRHPAVHVAPVAVSTSKKYNVLWLDGSTHPADGPTASESGRFPRTVVVCVGPGCGTAPPPLVLPPPPHAVSAAPVTNAKIASRLFIAPKPS